MALKEIAMNTIKHVFCLGKSKPGQYEGSSLYLENQIAVLKKEILRLAQRLPDSAGARAAALPSPWLMAFIAAIPTPEQEAERRGA